MKMREHWERIANDRLVAANQSLERARAAEAKTAMYRRAFIATGAMIMRINDYAADPKSASHDAFWKEAEDAVQALRDAGEEW